MHKIFKCVRCNRYTLNQTCPGCGSKTVSPLPARFSLADKFGIYRRKEKYGMAI